MDKVKIYVYAKFYLEREIAINKEILSRSGKYLVQSIKDDIELYEKELNQINDFLDQL